MAAIAIEYVSVGKLKPYAGNPRKISDAEMKKLRKSLQDFGFVDPVIANKSGEVIGGHQRLEAAKAEGIKTVPVVYLDIPDNKAKLLNVALNKISGEWDWPKLGDLFQELDTGELDLEMSGFDMAEIEGLMNGLDSANHEEEDEIPEPPAEPISKTGDLWLLGEHRLLCGDSTNRDDVIRLMNGKRAMIMNTDPPYGVGYANDDRPNPGVAKPRVAKPRVANDKLQDKHLQDFLETCFGIAVDIALEKNAAWYMWHAHLTQGYFAAAAAAAAAADVILHRQIIWVKPVLLLGRGHYHWKHEPCFMGWVKGNQPPDYGLGNGERTQTTIWEIGTVTQAERKEFNHSTPKPVELFEIPIIKHLQFGEICYEPFAGSGPQFIAAEKTNRKCYGIEIEPAFCDVIVKRWENYTGKKAKLSN